MNKTGESLAQNSGVPKKCTPFNLKGEPWFLSHLGFFVAHSNEHKRVSKSMFQTETKGSAVFWFVKIILTLSFSLFAIKQAYHGKLHHSRRNHKKQGTATILMERT